MLAKHALSVRRCFSIPLLLVHFSFVNFSSNARSFVSDKIPYLRDKASHMAFADGKSSYKCTRSSAMHVTTRISKIQINFFYTYQCMHLQTCTKMSKHGVTDC